MAYICIALTILFTVYGQLVLKWQASLSLQQWGQAAPLRYVVSMLLNPWVISGLGAAFAASLCWMLAVSRMDLSKAYPFTALNFVFVGLAAVPLFGEAYSLPKVLGLILVVAGILVSSQG
ncbi:EamA family transporter [Dyella humicola]|uniref:EamA family transporter n=1 Tax=Dyella humicola TaxID=2992126 RepID=UPI0022578355|nr:EamA family transporter [Dyella humicola]